MQTITNCFFIQPISSLIWSYYTRNGDEAICNDVENISTDICINDGLWGACEGGHMVVVEKMIACGANDWNFGLLGACEGGHMAVVEKMISCGALWWNMGLREACYGGHMVVVENMITKGADNWDLGLYWACYGGHMAVVEKMIACGATKICCKEHRPLFNQ